jgi:hypothetical protein
MNPTQPLVIHELLPSEIMGVIFEEHAKLEWRAPAIDGRVCRIWRQIVLDTPRAWIYLEISDEILPRIRELREWLDRSGSAPLYIRVSKGFTGDEHLVERPLHDLLGGYHARIESLRLPFGDPSFFEKQDFPCLRLLDIDRWYPIGSTSRPVRWDSTPTLRSLRLATAMTLPLQGSDLPPLEALTLYSIRLASPPQHSQSLTTLVLDKIIIGNWISSPISFPSLTYLSLYGVIGLKRYISAPRLVTYHEGWSGESLTPVPSLVEYGVYFPPPSIIPPHPAWLQRSFPNVLRLSIRAPFPTLILFFRSLSSDAHSLLALQTISVRVLGESFTEEEEATIMDLVRVRGKACQADVILYFDMKKPYQIPLFFGRVSHYLSNGCECLMRILGPGGSLVKAVGPGSGTLAQLAHARQNCHCDSCTTGLMSHVGKIDFQSIRVLIYFHLTLHDRIFLVDATFNVSMYVEQLVAVHPL